MPRVIGGTPASDPAISLSLEVPSPLLCGPAVRAGRTAPEGRYDPVFAWSNALCAAVSASCGVA